ncbi:hypothetical protein M8494_17640 [Serratia ureilytica]
MAGDRFPHPADRRTGHQHAGQHYADRLGAAAPRARHRHLDDLRLWRNAVRRLGAVGRHLAAGRQRQSDGAGVVRHRHVDRQPDRHSAVPRTS